MSYEIIYEKFATFCPADVVSQQKKDLLLKHFNINCTTMSDYDIDAELFRRFKIISTDNLYMLQLLIGPSNCVDTESGKRTRDWMYCGVDTEYSLFQKYGCEWCRSVESGDLKPNGRWATPEGWLKSLRLAFKQAVSYEAMPYCHSMSFWIVKPTTWEDQYKLKQFESIVSSFGADIMERSWFGTRKLYCSFSPESMFEMYLFQELSIRFFGKRAFSTTSPSLGLVKQRAI